MSGAKCNAPKSVERNDREGDNATMLLPWNAEKTSPERGGGGQEEVRQRLNERNLSALSAKYSNVCEDVGWMIPLRLRQAHGCKRVARDAQVGLSTKLRIQTEFTNTTEAVEGISGPR
jgi:hypothetical protein